MPNIWTELELTFTNILKLKTVYFHTNRTCQGNIFRKPSHGGYCGMREQL